tara:strand:- start:121307 stop:122335 length:1029 start_codon:yes stop_codon:yes gene_type:complete
MYEKQNEQTLDLLRAMADRDQRKAEAARKAFAAELVAPLRRGIFDADNLGDIYTPQVIPYGATASYPLDFVRPGDEDSYTAYTLAEQGRLPERRVEASEINVPTFKIGNSIDWDIKFMKEARWDVVKRALAVFEAGFVRKINSDGWRTVLAAAADRGLVVEASGTAAFTGSSSCLTTAPNPGEFTKELVSRLHTAMTRGAGGNGNGGRLTDLYLSLEAMECVRAWDASRIDEFTRREIFTSADKGLAQIYGVIMHSMTEFGQDQEYDAFLETVLSLAKPGGTEQFCVGLDLSADDSFVMPIKEELEVYDDDALTRFQRMGVFGWMRHGFACLDNRRVLLGAF